MSGVTDVDFMVRALHLARKGLYSTDPNPRVGCVLVKDQQIIAEGWHQWAGQAHAEIAALQTLNPPELAIGSTAFVTLEPCSHHGRTAPCADALLAAGVSRVVVAMQDPNPLVAGQGLQRLREAGVEVVCGLLQEDAEQLNRGFIKRMTCGLPFIRSKLATSLDGRTAMASGESQWITSAESRQDVQRFRAESSAIVTGIDTVIQDDPRLNARVDFELRQPIKVVLDSTLRMPLSAKMLHDAAETWIITCSDDQAKQQRLRDAGCQVWQVAALHGRVDLAQAFHLLAQQQINSVWVEAGATLNGALLTAGLVDEWLIYMAPCILGDQARGLFHLPQLQQLQDKKTLHLLETRSVGQDVRLRFSSAS